MGAGRAFLGAIFFPCANVVICWEDVVDELRQVNTAVKVSMNGFFMNGPVDVMHDSVRPFVSLLDILLKRRTVSSVSDEGFVVVSDRGSSNL
jgi:uncharacterized membrane protein YjfL (UPF0719 family)